MKTSVPTGTTTDQLFVNRQLQILARYPNYNASAKYLNGYVSDAISRERAQRWPDPRRAHIHDIHQYLWGDMHYVITGKSADGNVTYEGGWQNNRPKPMHAQYRFVENVFEQLDSPGEWYLDKANLTLYCPPTGLDLSSAAIETVPLKVNPRNSIHFTGPSGVPRNSTKCNNLCLHGGLKLRQCFYRTCENNVLVNNTLHPHVWYNDSDDIFRSNIVFEPYRPIQMREWTEVIDFNLLHQPALPQTSPATALQKLSSQDVHTLQGDALFVDEGTGDYRVKSNSPALSLGFVNFDMEDFGVQSPKLKAIARHPVMPLRSSDTTPSLNETRSREIAVWAGVKVRNIVGLDEVSAAGSPGETGVILLEVPDTSDAAKAGFFAGDVVLAFNGKPIRQLKDLLQDTQQNIAGKAVSVTILSFQQESTIMITLKP